MKTYEAQRREMVEKQLRPRGITDPGVLEAMGSVPREKFVPPERNSRAYCDGPLPIGEGQTISQPYMVALMTQSLRLTGEERVLEVGTGSGYQAAILAHLAEWVYTIERVPALAEAARRLLVEQMGLENVTVRVGDGTLGWAEQAPFERIIVTAAAPHTPRVPLEQLAPGGLLVAPVGSEYSQSLMRFSKDRKGDWQSEDLCQCVFVKLIGHDGWEGPA